MEPQEPQRPEKLAPAQPSGAKLNLRLDLRVVAVVLVLVIVGMLVVWKPWVTKAQSDRTISVSGDAKLTATPDEFVFNPSYDFKNTDKTAALAALTAKSADVVAKLKALGVASTKIAADSSGNNYDFSYDDTDNTYTYTLSLTVTVDDATLAQKVQDYLVSTSPTGEVSPTADFSTAKQKQLESQARDEATKDARAKAEQSAKNLGFKVGAVKSVNDGGFDGGIQPYTVQGGVSMGSNLDSKPSLAVQPGQNDLDYSVTVVYYVR